MPCILIAVQVFVALLTADSQNIPKDLVYYPRGTNSVQSLHLFLHRGHSNFVIFSDRRFIVHPWLVSLDVGLI